MAFITLAEAVVLRNSFIAQLPKRLDDLVRAAVQSGAASVPFPYAPASDAQAQAFVTTVAIPAGWAGSTVDTVNKIITISP